MSDNGGLTKRVIAAGMLLCLAALAQAREIVHIDFLAGNPARLEYTGVLYIPAGEVEALIPGFDGFSFLVTTTNSPDVASDLEERRALELPSQAIDDDGDGRADRIGVYVTLRAGEKKIVTLHSGAPDRILRLKGRYAKTCNAERLSGGAAGLWESDKVAYSYHPSSGKLFPIPKAAARPVAEQLPPRRLREPFDTGFEIMRAPGALKDAEVIASGPLAAGWRVAAADWKSTFVIGRNDRWTFVRASLPGKSGPVAAGIPKRAGELVLSGEGWVATLAGSPALGLAIFVPRKYLHTGSSAARHTLLLKPDEQGQVRYALAAYSELEHQANVVGPGETEVRLPNVPGAGRSNTSPRILLRPPRMDAEAFRAQIARDIESLTNPPGITRVSSRAVSYAALLPPHAPPAKKTYAQAVELVLGQLRLRMERAGGKLWFSSDPQGQPSFRNPRTTWGEGYLVSMLWDGYKLTGDSWFKQAALETNERMLGGEEMEAHATGLNYWNASVRSYRETGDPRWRASALKCADMTVRIADPVTGLIPEYGRAQRQQPDDPYHQNNYVKIDALVGLPILWWAYEETKDKRYLDAADRHMAATIKMLIEPDGAALQQLWLKPGTREILGIATHQGYSANSRWARGAGWILDGFADAYRVAKNPLYRDVFERSARFVEANLPEDLVSWYDFDDQAVFWRYRDSSTTAICAYGLLRMSALEPDPARARRYREFGARLVDALIDRCLTPVGPADPRPPGMLAHTTYTKPVEGEFIWGTYSLLRSLCWLKDNGVVRAEAR